MDKLVNKLEELRLNILDNSWVEAIYHSEYLEFGEIPEEYDTLLKKIKIRPIFRSIMNAVGSWLTTETDADEEKSWATLSHQVPHRKLLAVLGYYIHQGTKHVMNEQYRTNALLSARVYFKLLSIPGFIAYDIYHSQLFAHSLACVGFPKIICDKYDEQKTKSKDDKDKEDKIANIQELRDQVNSLIKQLQLFVIDLRAIIEQLQLRPSDMNFEDILNNLVDVTGGAIVNKLNVDRIELVQLTQIIYEVIHILVCDANKQPDSLAVNHLLKCLHGKLVAVCLDTRAANLIVRASYVAYSGVVLSTYGKAALDNFLILLENLCYTLDGLERAEARLARVQMVAGLMSLLPGKIHSKLVAWLIKLSKSSKVLHRHMAVDVLEKMLIYNDGGAPEVNGENQTVIQKEGGPMDTEAATTNGADDNQKENVEAQTLDNENQTNAMDVSENDQKSSNVIENPVPDVTEEDLQRILHERTITVPYGAILRAVCERVVDVSGTVRTRAVAILTKCLDNMRPAMKQAFKEIHGEGYVARLMAVAARSVCDDRAVVRRAGVALAHRLLEAQDAQPAAIDLGVLVGMCRDASVIVRTAAITSLADLVLKRPSTAVFDAFLSGPMHQLSDPENKVQDTMKSLVQGLLVDRLKKYTIADEDPIPWMLLAGITRHNMRRHLQKACTHLAKSTSCISVWLVDCLSTHLGALGAARDLQALVMLTSVARHVEYSDVSFVLQYYYRLVDASQEEENDPRLMPLTLELLSVWSRFTSAEERAALRDHLVRRLAAPSDDGCRIACAFLAAQLDETNLNWATELMQLAERSALRGGWPEEWLRAADLSLVAPVPPAPELMQLFLQAINNPPADWSPRRAGECVAGLGRLCVRSRAAAAAAAPAPARLLHSDAPLQARVNALLVLSDMCIRYTNIVEPLLGSVCQCLEQQAPQQLRRQAARALTRLLLAGYLRLRTPLYYKYCALLADEDHDVREPAEYYVTCCLTTDSIYHHFVDCVQYYNAETSENISFDARQLIYDVMLQRLSLVQKLNTQCRLAREILEHAADLVDEGEELSQSMNNALLDTITVLCGPRMRLPKKQAPATGDLDTDDLQERVTTNIVSHKMKHTVAEVLVPAALRLHARLRAGGGQLLAYLVRLVTDLLNDYRQEIEDLIETDEELVEQIEQFQETIGLEPANGNARNLVTSSAPPEPETPRAPRRRAPARAEREPLRKRTLRI